MTKTVIKYLNISSIKNTVSFIYLFLFLIMEPNYCQIINSSFETEDGDFSTLGWNNWSGIASSDTPPEGGNWSLELRSGCVWSNCSHYIPDAKDGDIFEINCWAKTTDSYGGGEIFFLNDLTFYFSIYDTIWTKINVIDTVELADDQDSLFFFLSGGGGYAGMGGARYDLVSVTKKGNITSLELEEALPSSFNLLQNYPNPFNPSTTINYRIPQETHSSIPSREGKERSDRGVLVTLKVYDVLGREVATLVSEEQSSGKYQVRFDASHLPTGTYFYRLMSGSYSETKKLVILK
ncbi:MAG: T9SS type A sorting domain-containing protein [Bacteroidota bacterium]